MLKQFKDTEVEMKSTYKVQMASLQMFATTLGYVLNGKKLDENGEPQGFNFAFAVPVKTARSFVTVGTMQQWHNTNFGIGDLKDIETQEAFIEAVTEAAIEYGFHPDQLITAFTCKLVERTKFQELRDGTLVLNDLQVSFAE